MMSRDGRFTSVRGPMACPTVFLLLLASGCAPDSPGTPAIAGPAAVPATATAGMDVGDAVVIRSLLAPEKCLTIRGGSATQGTPTELQPCAGGSDQQFTFLTTGEIRTQVGLCLDASSGRGNLGDAVITWPCIGEPNQQWSVTSTGELRGINDLCVDVWRAVPNDGQPIVVWRCHGGANQKWDVESMTATQPPAGELPPAQRTRVALAFDPASSLAASARVGPAPSAVGTPTYVAGPPARYALDPKEAVDFGGGALDDVWTSTQGWTYIATVQTGARADAPHYILAKENSKTPQFAFFRNAAGGFELIVHTPAPSYENVQSVAVPDFATVVVAMRFDPQKPHGQRAKLYINGAPAAEVSHTVSGTGGAIPASSARLRMGVVEWGGNRASPALGAAYAYSGVLTDAEIATNSAWAETNRLWEMAAPGSVASVEVVPGAAALEVGGTRQFTATVRDAAGAVLAGRAVAWATSDAAVASVTGAGLVTARAAGAAALTATSEGVAGQAALTVAAVPPPEGGACRLVTGTVARAAGPLAKPGYLQSLVDPAFGTTLTRVSGDPGTPIPVVGGAWPQVAGPAYAKVPGWSADGAYLLLSVAGAVGGGVSLVLDGATYRVVGRAGPAPSYAWHPSAPDVLIGVSGGGSVVTHNVRTGATATRVAVSGYTGAWLGKGEGNPSNDGRYVPVVARRAADGREVVYVADAAAGTKSADLDPAAQGFSDLDWAGVSQSGRYLFLFGTADGVWGRAKVYDRATLARVHYWTDYPTGHSDLGVDAAGNDVIFGVVGAAPYAHHFIARRLDTGAIADLTGAVVSYNWHATTRNTARPGWGYAATNDRRGYPLDGEVYAVKLDGSGLIERYAHHRANVTDYDAHPFPVPSPDGRRVLFRSNWGASGGRPVQAYVADARPLCP